MRIEHWTLNIIWCIRNMLGWLGRWYSHRQHNVKCIMFEGLECHHNTAVAITLVNGIGTETATGIHMTVFLLFRVFFAFAFASSMISVCVSVSKNVHTSSEWKMELRIYVSIFVYQRPKWILILKLILQSDSIWNVIFTDLNELFTNERISFS